MHFIKSLINKLNPMQRTSWQTTYASEIEAIRAHAESELDGASN